MAARLRVVFDANVYISAAINRAGPAAGWLRIAGSGKRSFDLYASEAILVEVAEKLGDKFQLNLGTVTQFIAGIQGIAVLVIPTERVRVVKYDPDDDMLFECALAAKAHLIVSSDKQVLKVKQYRGIGVAHPRDLKNIFAADLDRAV